MSCFRTWQCRSVLFGFDVYWSTFYVFYSAWIFTVRFWYVLIDVDLCYWVLICTVLFWSVWFGVDMFYSVLICTVRCRCVLFGFVLSHLTVIYSIRFWSVLFGVDVFYSVLIYEAFHVNCPSARHASPKSCYF